MHVAKTAGERKHGTVSSLRRGVQKAELGIASPHSSLNLWCFCTAGGPFGTWSEALSGLGLGPFRDLVWGPFGAWSGALSGLGLAPFRDFVGVLSEAHRGKRKNNKREMQSKYCVHSHFAWLVSRTQEGCTPCRNEAYKKVQGQQPWVLTKRRASQQNM